jgi:hypothetical protein
MGFGPFVVLFGDHVGDEVGSRAGVREVWLEVSS